MRIISALSLAASLSLTVLACGGSDSESGAESGAAADSLIVSDSWSRQPAAGQAVSAVYLTVKNTSDRDIRLTSATVDVSTRVELHETLMNDEGAMSMQEVDEGFVVPAEGTFVFEPGGPHIMVFDIDAATYPSEVAVTLTTEDESTLDFSAEVRSIGGGMGDMDDMEDGDEGHSDDGEHDMESDSMSEDAMEEDSMSEDS